MAKWTSISLETYRRMDNQTNRKDIPEVKAETAFNAVILDESIVTFNM